MAKTDTATARTNEGTPNTTTADAIEQRVVALAEQLGRIAGTVQAKAEGWLDRDTLNKQMVSVRDAASDLLEQLAGGAAKAAQAANAARAARVQKKPAAAPAPAVARNVSKGRSGGVVDARGKKHRKPLPADPGAKVARSQAAKMRTAMPMAKTNKRRGRG